jgi:hypothetical protein
MFRDSRGASVPKPIFVVCVMLGALLMLFGNIVAAQKTSADASQCSKEILQNFVVRNKPASKGGVVQGTVAIWSTAGGKAFFYVSRMDVDADGAPNAYNPKNTGLDDVRNAGDPGNWYGLVIDEKGNPVIQKEGDPFPGFYVSRTSLCDRTITRKSDPRKYVDATKVPYLVLPPAVAKLARASLGDFAVVVNLDNGKVASAIYADSGNSFKIGEGSIALAEALRIGSNPRKGNSARHVFYLVFPGSGNQKPRPLEEINTEGKRLFQSWGGMEQVNQCVAQK